MRICHSSYDPDTIDEPSLRHDIALELRHGNRVPDSLTGDDILVANPHQLDDPSMLVVGVDHDENGTVYLFEVEVHGWYRWHDTEHPDVTYVICFDCFTAEEVRDDGEYAAWCRHGVSSWADPGGVAPPLHLCPGVRDLEASAVAAEFVPTIHVTPGPTA